MVEKGTAVKCVEKIEPDRYIVFGSFAKPNAMVCATHANSEIDHAAKKRTPRNNNGTSKV